MTTFFQSILGELEALECELEEDLDTAIKSGCTPKERAAAPEIAAVANRISTFMVRFAGPSAIKALALGASDLVASVGTEVKSVGRAGWTEGYLVRFGGDGDLSPFRDIFLKNTDYGRRKSSDVYVHHRQLPGRYGDAMLQNEARLDMDDLGIFCKHLLDLSDEYEATLHKLVQAGKLRWSSGTAPHLVKRERQPNGTHHVKRWILGLDASYTLTPAGGFGTGISAMKSLLATAGVDLSRPPAPPRALTWDEQVKAVVDALPPTAHERWMNELLGKG